VPPRTHLTSTVIASRVIGGASIPNLLSSRAALLAARRSPTCCHREPRYWRRGDPQPAVIASRVIGGAAIPNLLSSRPALGLPWSVLCSMGAALLISNAISQFE